jgi:RNA recognition motif-containing protein
LTDTHKLRGHVIEVKEFLPPEEARVRLNEEKRRKIFVGGLHVQVDEAGLINYFSQFGPVASCNIVFNHLTKASRGFGFVIFKDEKTVQEVLKRYDDHYLHGKWMEVKRAALKDELQTNTPSTNQHANSDTNRHGSRSRHELEESLEEDHFDAEEESAPKIDDIAKYYAGFDNHDDGSSKEEKIYTHYFPYNGTKPMSDVDPHVDSSRGARYKSTNQYMHKEGYQDAYPEGMNMKYPNKPNSVKKQSGSPGYPHPEDQGLFYKYREDGYKEERYPQNTYEGYDDHEEDNIQKAKKSEKSYGREDYPEVPIKKEYGSDQYMWDQRNMDGFKPPVKNSLYNHDIEQNYKNHGGSYNYIEEEEHKYLNQLGDPFSKVPPQGPYMQRKPAANYMGKPEPSPQSANHMEYYDYHHGSANRGSPPHSSYSYTDHPDYYGQIRPQPSASTRYEPQDSYQREAPGNKQPYNLHQAANYDQHYRPERHECETSHTPTRYPQHYDKQADDGHDDGGYNHHDGPSRRPADHYHGHHEDHRPARKDGSHMPTSTYGKKIPQPSYGYYDDAGDC